MEGGDLLSRFLAYILTASFKVPSPTSPPFACPVCACSAIECRCDCRVAAPTVSCTSEVGLAVVLGALLGFFIGLLVCGVRGATRVNTEAVSASKVALKTGGAADSSKVSLGDLAKAQIARVKK
jgi:hypothetical protein